MKDEIKKELEQLGSSLHKRKVEIDAWVPGNYFQEMQGEVFDKLSSNPAQNTTTGIFGLLQNFWRRSTTSRIGISLAGIALILILALTLIKPFESDNGQMMAGLDETISTEFLDENIDELDVYTISEFLELDEFDFATTQILNEDEYYEEAAETIDLIDLEELL